MNGPIFTSWSSCTKLAWISCLVIGRDRDIGQSQSGDLWGPVGHCQPSCPLWADRWTTQTWSLHKGYATKTHNSSSLMMPTDDTSLSIREDLTNFRRFSYYLELVWLEKMCLISHCSDSILYGGLCHSKSRWIKCWFNVGSALQIQRLMFAGVMLVFLSEQLQIMKNRPRGPSHWERIVSLSTVKMILTSLVFIIEKLKFILTFLMEIR